MRHAYLIMAHANFEQLSFLIQRLDHPKNDIFIHIDKNSGQIPSELLMNSAKLSKVVLSERMAVYWGGESQIHAELLLFKTAQQYGEYRFYHLISGADLPIQPQEVMHHFFSQYPDKIFLNIMTLDGDSENINRIKYYHFFESFNPRTIPGVIGKGLFKCYRFLEVKCQQILRVNRLKKYQLTCVKASQWVSLPHDVVLKMIYEEQNIKKIFRYSFLCDEMFIPMMIDAWGMNDRIYDRTVNHNTENEFQGNLRHVNWWDGNPYVWSDSPDDVKKLEGIRNKGYLFARKFDIERFKNIKSVIDNWVR